MPLDRWSISESWHRYREAILVAYPDVDGRREFTGSEVPERDLEEIADRSSALTALLLEQQEPYDDQEARDLETAILTATVVDTTVAADVFIALREEAGTGRPGVEVPASIEAEVPSEEERERIDDVLDLADRVFPEVSGAAPDPSRVGVRANRAVVELLDAAIPVAADFGTGVITAGVGGLISVLGPFEPIRNVLARAGGRLLSGCRLIENAVEKLTGLLGMEAEAGVDIGLEDLGEKLGAGIESWSAGAARKLIRVDRVEYRIMRLSDGKVPEESRLEGLDTELNTLCTDFRRNMGLATKIRKGLRFSAPALIIIGAGAPGKAALSGVYGLGVTYCLLAVAVRLDTVPGWVDGVTTILENSVGPPVGPKPCHFRV
jgi:hypothetical protein